MSVSNLKVSIDPIFVYIFFRDEKTLGMCFVACGAAKGRGLMCSEVGHTPHV